ncbi:MAG TPA: carbon-nitrogen hydrolase family protein, partial [Anaerolineales bacterium]
MERPLSLALVQMQPVLGDQAANLETVLERTQAAADKGAQLVIFPELALTGYNQQLLGERLVRLALGPQDEPLQKLGQAAARRHIHLVVGYIEKRAIPGVVYNSIAIFGPDGSLLRRYAKSHLFSGEHLHYRPGAEIQALPVDLGTLGPMICMDSPIQHAHIRLTHALPADQRAAG